MFRRKKWKYLILDEAHNIKNFQSQRWQARERVCVCERERVCVCERERERECVCEREREREGG